jgi:hypothetical protein
MTMPDTDRAARQFERHVFRGVPEQPESNLERDSNLYAHDRQSGKSQLEDDPTTHILRDAIHVGTITYRLDANEVSYERTTEPDVKAVQVPKR